MKDHEFQTENFYLQECGELGNPEVEVRCIDASKFAEIVHGEDSMAVAKLVVEKWEMILEWVRSTLPQGLNNIDPHAYCAWCRLYAGDYCHGCPLFIKYKSACCGSASYNMFLEHCRKANKKRAILYAQKIIDTAKEIINEPK